MQTGLYSLKTREEFGAMPHDGSFTRLWGRGQAFTVTVDKAFIKFIKSIYPNDILWDWATIPINNVRIFTFRDDDNNTVRVPIILLSSIIDKNGNVVRSIVKVIETSKDGRMVKLDAIPYQRSGDYSAFRPELKPWLWQEAYTDYRDGTYGCSHTKNGVDYTFKYPLLDCSSGFKASAEVKAVGGFWIPVDCLYELVTPDALPEDMQYFKLNVDGETCHVHVFDTRTTKVDVSPNIFRTVREAETYLGKGKLWINGDGWDWRTPSHPIGRSMSNGVWTYKGTGDEASIYFGKPGQVSIAPFANIPMFIPQNVVSYPNQLVKNGGIPKAFEDYLHAARQGFGITQDGKQMIVVTVEGDEYKNIGPTAMGMARIMITLGIYNGVQFDGGGSTQFLDSFGNYYSSETPNARRVINQIRFS